MGSVLAGAARAHISRGNDGREGFGVDLALAQHILGLPANQMPPAPPHPRGQVEGRPSFALLGLMQARQVKLQGNPFEVSAKPVCR